MSLSVPSLYYIIPTCHLQGSLADMLFWDALYYLLAIHGLSNPQGHRYVETNYDELQSLTGLTRKTLRKQIDKALASPAPYQIKEEEGIAPQSWVLKHRFYDTINQGKRIQKPVGMMQQGWGWVLAQPYIGHKKSSRFPLAILNILLRKPAGHTTTIQELAQRVKKSTAHAPPDLTHIQQAITHLEALALINSNSSGVWVIKEQFNLDGRVLYKNLAETAVFNSTQDTLVQWGNKIDIARTKTTLEIMHLGQFEASYFKEIFHSLAHIQHQTDLSWLLYAVHRHRHRLQTHQRWQNCWQLFQNTLQKNMYGTTSKKVHINLSKQSAHKLQLTLPQHDPQTLRWCKLVLWICDARFLSCGIGREEKVKIEVWDANSLIWQCQLGYEHEIVRCDLTAIVRKQTMPIIQIQITTPSQLPQFSLDCLLEAQYLTPRDIQDAS